MKKINLSHLRLSDEEEIFAARIIDCFVLSQQKNTHKITGFLDERQQVIAACVAQHFPGTTHSFYGGYPDAERVMLGVFADYYSNIEQYFPITSIAFHYRAEDKLCHRDFLGCVLHLGLKREVIGDILVGEGVTNMLVASHVAAPIIDSITKIGRVGVTASKIEQVSLSLKRELEEHTDVIASLRLDCVVSAFTRKSRERASDLIKGGYVSVNGQPVDTPSKSVKQGDKLSLRGYGRFILTDVSSVTRKGRVVLNYQKYR